MNSFHSLFSQITEMKKSWFPSFLMMDHKNIRLDLNRRSGPTKPRRLSTHVTINEIVTCQTNWTVSLNTNVSSKERLINVKVSLICFMWRSVWRRDTFFNNATINRDYSFWQEKASVERVTSGLWVPTKEAWGVQGPTFPQPCIGPAAQRKQNITDISQRAWTLRHQVHLFSFKIWKF